MSKKLFFPTAISSIDPFSPDNFLMVNKEVLSTFGPYTALFLSNLIDKFYKNGNGHEVIYPLEKQSKDTGMSVYILRKCKKELIKAGIIKTYTKDIPAKEIYVLDLEILYNIDCRRILGEE